MASVGGRLRGQGSGVTAAWGYPEMGSGAGSTEQGQGIGVRRGRVSVVAAVDQKERTRAETIGPLQRAELFEISSGEPFRRPLGDGRQRNRDRVERKVIEPREKPVLIHVGTVGNHGANRGSLRSRHDGNARAEGDAEDRGALTSETGTATKIAHGAAHVLHLFGPEAEPAAAGAGASAVIEQGVESGRVQHARVWNHTGTIGVEAGNENHCAGRAAGRNKPAVERHSIGGSKMNRLYRQAAGMRRVALGAVNEDQPGHAQNRNREPECDEHDEEKDDSSFQKSNSVWRRKLSIIAVSVLRERGCQAPRTVAECRLKAGTMTDIDAVCDRVARRLYDHPTTHDDLMDLATVLLLVSGRLRELLRNYTSVHGNSRQALASGMALDAIARHLGRLHGRSEDVCDEALRRTLDTALHLLVRVSAILETPARRAAPSAYP